MSIEGADVVWHLAANPDVRLGAQDTNVHIEQNVIATHNVLEAMRKNGVKRIVFTSTSTVYGEAKKIPTREDYGRAPYIALRCIEACCEALIASYCHTFDMSAVILRYANCMEKGVAWSHFDFVNKLKMNPKALEILAMAAE